MLLIYKGFNAIYKHLQIKNNQLYSGVSGIPLMNWGFVNIKYFIKKFEN